MTYHKLTGSILNFIPLIPRGIVDSVEYILSLPAKRIISPLAIPFRGPVKSPNIGVLDAVEKK